MPLFFSHKSRSFRSASLRIFGTSMPIDDALPTVFSVVVMRACVCERSDVAHSGRTRRLVGLVRQSPFRFHRLPAFQPISVFLFRLFVADVDDIFCLFICVCRSHRALSRSTNVLVFFVVFFSIFEYSIFNSVCVCYIVCTTVRLIRSQKLHVQKRPNKTKSLNFITSLRFKIKQSLCVWRFVVENKIEISAFHYLFLLLFLLLLLLVRLVRVRSEIEHRKLIGIAKNHAILQSCKRKIQDQLPK
jgi:hypothetical protein